MRFKIKSLSFLIICALTTVSCSNYYLTTASLRNQFAGMDSPRLKSVVVKEPLGEKYNYLANSSEVISCFDKKGNVSELINVLAHQLKTSKSGRRKSTHNVEKIPVTKN
jgi:hypothetical protein